MTDDAAMLRSWLDNMRAQSTLQVQPIPLGDCAGWRYEDGRLKHGSSRFFEIVGLAEPKDRPGLPGNMAAMIDQPEIGWLAFFVRKAEHGVEWLLQAKTEPGNMNGTEFAPTVQATRSNYTRLHGGRRTYFLRRLQGGRSFLSDAPHSEQGTRFLWKFNRNSVLALPRDASLDLSDKPNWRWCGSQALRVLLGESHMVNTDARSVVATAPWPLLSTDRALFRAGVLARSYGRSVRPLPVHLRDVDERKVDAWQLVPLHDMAGWQFDETGIVQSGGHAAVRYYRIAVVGREVSTWCQPFLEQGNEGDVALFMRVRDGEAQVLLRLYREPGFGRRSEFGPTLHDAFETPPELAELCGHSDLRDLMSIRQTDEGGRFMKVNASYRICLVENGPRRGTYRFGKWVGLSTLEALTRKPGTTTNELRTLVSMLLSQPFDDICRELE